MELLDILSKLIAFKTVTADQDECRRGIKFIADELVDFGIKTNQFESEGYSSLIGFNNEEKKPKVLLVAHFDVVPATEGRFKAEVKNGVMLGRGVIDMKFAIATYLKLISDLKSQLDNFSFGILITTDEEIGGFNGTRLMVEKGAKPEVVFLPDGGYGGVIESGAKGVIQLKITASGHETHASRPWEGENANLIIIKYLSEANDLFTQEPCGDISHYHSTFNIGKISGGKAINQLSGSASAYLDIRYPPSESHDAIIDKLNRLKVKFPRIQIKELISAYAFQNETKNRETKLFKNLLEKYTHTNVNEVFSHGSSDARYFREKNIPVLSIKPLGGDHHSEKEWLDVDYFKLYYQAFKEWFEIIARIE